MAKPYMNARTTHGTNFSMMGTDITITGNINASADLHVDGSIDGDITCNAFVQGESSEINGAITAESVRIGGLVRGSVSARDVIIQKTARIIGDVNYDTLTIEQGARLDGRLSPNSCQQASPTIARLPVVETGLMLSAAAE